MDSALDNRISCLDHGYIELVDSMPDPRRHSREDQYRASTEGLGFGDKAVVNAARVSIEGESVRPLNDDQKLLGYLLRNKHSTPFEVVRFTFRVKLPIFIERQWVRHRMASTNEMSARYGVLPDCFYIPPLERMQKQSVNNKQGSSAELVDDAERIQEGIEYHARVSYELYEKMLGMGLSRELARMVLPINIYTLKQWTVDLHNLMHFLRLRLHEHAQHEIRVYAEAIRKLIMPIVPATMAVFEETLAV